MCMTGSSCKFSWWVSTEIATFEDITSRSQDKDMLVLREKANTTGDPWSFRAVPSLRKQGQLPGLRKVLGTKPASIFISVTGASGEWSRDGGVLLRLDSRATDY